MVRSIEFKSVRNNFQSTLREDLNKIKPSRNLLVFADKKGTCMKCHPIPTSNENSTKKPKNSPRN